MTGGWCPAPAPPAPALCPAGTDPHSGQGPSAGAPPPAAGPLVRETKLSPALPPPPEATAARAAAALVSGLPQSQQNCAPAPFCRAQNWQAPGPINVGCPN